MNLVYGQIVEIFSQDGLAMGRVTVQGAIKKIAVGLLTNVRRGDRVPYLRPRGDQQGVGNDGIRMTKPERNICFATFVTFGFRHSNFVI